MVQVPVCPPARPVFKENACSADNENTDPGEYCVKGGRAKSGARMPVNACHVQGSENERNQKADHDDQKAMAPQKDRYGLKHTLVFQKKNSATSQYRGDCLVSSHEALLCRLCMPHAENSPHASPNDRE
jgi:hypothetical protein